MPPLERRENNGSITPLGTDVYVSVFDNRLIQPTTAGCPGKSKTDVFSTAPLRRDSAVHPVLAERDVIVGTNPLYEYTLRNQPSNDEDDCETSSLQSSGTFSRYSCQTVSCAGGSHTRVDLLDIFANMCLGPQYEPHYSPRNRRKARKAAVASRKRVVYPIAKYPARLNSPVLVQQRRMSLQKHLTFKPVRTDSMRSDPPVQQQQHQHRRHDHPQQRQQHHHQQHQPHVSTGPVAVVL